MTAYPIENPFTSFANVLGFQITGGRIYIGVPGMDPETSPQPVYWDADSTIPAAQPLSMKGGYVVRNGTPARAYTADNYSIRVYDALGAVVFYEPSAQGELMALFGQLINSLWVSSRTALASLSVDVVKTAYLNEGKRSGFFALQTGIAPTDPQQGIYVASNTAGYYWKRVYDGLINVMWFGAVGDGVTDDTVPMQASINLAQLTKAWLFLPPVTYAYMVSGLTIGIPGTDYTCHFQGGGFDPSFSSQGGITGQFTGQSMIKLIAGSNRSLIVSTVDAAPPQFKNITLNGNGTVQSGTSYCLELSDATAATYYRYAAWMEDCLITAGRSGGLFIGQNRGAGYYENVAVQYCGTTSSDSAILCRCFDQQFIDCQIGPNPGTGLYLGTVTQIQIVNTVMFLNNIGMSVTAGVGHLQVVNTGFDSNAMQGTLIVGGGTIDGDRLFANCHWRRNGLLANNTYADITIDSDRRVAFTSPGFGGKEDNANGVKYCFEFLATTQTPIARVIGAITETVSGNAYQTSFSNNDGDIILAGMRDAYLGRIGGSQSISGMVLDFERWRTDAVGTKFLAKLYAPKDDGTMQTASATYAGAGAPSNANGNNGDFYFRSDGGSGSRIYFKTGGSWTGIV